MLPSLLVMVSLCAGTQDAAPDQGRPADRILQDIREARQPALPDPRGHSQDEIRTRLKEYRDATRRAALRRADLIRELYLGHPQHPALANLLPSRWYDLLSEGVADGLDAEIEEAAARLKRPELRTDGVFVRALDRVARAREEELDAASKTIDAFVAGAPNDERGADLLYMLLRRKRDPGDAAALEERIIRGFPQSRRGRLLKAERDRREGVGKPFELDFTDAIGGKPVSMKDLRGKVVVIDFWATWCAPCIRDLPRLKELHARYKDQGVVFLGVSLDEPEADGGLKALRTFVAREQIPWPQYYPGNGFESEICKALSITEIPRVVVVDAKGDLASSDASHLLETLIPELVSQAAE